MLPEAITHGGGGDEQFDDDFTVSRIVPEQQHTAYENQQRTAAELGFDDSQYGRPDSGDLDMVGRSLNREERRAALEAQTSGEQAPGYPQDERPLFRDEVPSGGAYQDYPAQAYAEADQPLYDDRSHGSHAFGEPGFAETTGQQPYVSHEAAQPDEWAEHPAFEGYFGTEAESDRNTTAAPADAAERVPFERPGPTPSDAPR